MSHLLVSAVCLLLGSAAAQAVPIKLGLLGDSIVDDYLGPALLQGGNTNLAAGSFGQILGATRSSDFDFGDYKSVADGTWDTLRYSGYEYNWATAGAAASSSAVVKLDFGPPTGVAPVPVSATLAAQTSGMVTLVAQGKVDTVYVSTGGNDFFYKSNVIDIINGGLYPAADGQITQAFTDDIASAILASVDALQSAGNVDIIVAKVPVIPIMDQAQIDGVFAVNAILELAAANREYYFFDSQAWTINGSNVDPVTRAVTVGDVVVEYASTASAADIGPDGIGVFCTAEGLCPKASHAQYYIAEDGIHLNTLMQGQLANEIIRILNSEFGHDVDLIGDDELLNLVGITPVPLPPVAWLFGSGLALFGWFVNRHGIARQVLRRSGPRTTPAMS